MVAGAALRPVERMRAEAAEISADEPGRRLRVPDTGDELARLGTTMNEMLAGLEQAIEHERRFVDDASHQLRTPLGTLKTELELALRKARIPVSIEIRGNTPTRANVDSARLRQALSNLIDNGLRHSPRGGSVVVDIDAADERVLLSIADEGPGFLPIS